MFKDSLPSKLQEYPTVSSFIDVLDGLQDFKHGVIADSLRVYNPALCSNRKWLVKQLADYGVKNFPEDMPLEIMQLYLLNIDTILRTRGSKIGLELWLNVLTLGNVSVNDDNFYQESQALLLDSTTQGYLTNQKESNHFGLIDDNDYINPTSRLNISITSPYYPRNVIGGLRDSPTWRLIRQYIYDNIDEQLGFSKLKVTWRFSNRLGNVYHRLLNKYFTNKTFIVLPTIPRYEQDITETL